MMIKYHYRPVGPIDEEETEHEVSPGAVGEILVHTPQLQDSSQVHSASKT